MVLSPVNSFSPAKLWRLSAAVSALWAWSMTAAAADTWPQWRGPTRDGQVEGTPWPSRLQAPDLNQRWRVELGPGYSGPIVTPDRVFTTETVDKKLERVRALDRATGRELWRQEWEGAMSVPFFARSNGDWIRATPAWDGETLYVAGMRDVLVALDGRDGRIRWQKDFVKEFGTPLPAFGFVSSPLVVGKALYVQAGGGVLRLDTADGRVVWRSLESNDGMMGSAFSSPVHVTLAGRPQVVVQTRTELVGLNPEYGTVLWRQPVEAFRGMNILTPTVVGDRVMTSTYGGRTLAWDVREERGDYRIEPAWDFKAQGYMSSPVVIDGHAYVHLRSQRVLCLQIADGAERWTTSESFGKYWSLVAQKDRVLALDEKGELLLFRANPTRWELLDRRRVSEEESWAHLAVADDDVFVRDLKGMSAWSWKAAPASAAAQ